MGVKWAKQRFALGELPFRQKQDSTLILDTTKQFHVNNLHWNCKRHHKKFEYLTMCDI